jgi:hypothetical protein
MRGLRILLILSILSLFSCNTENTKYELLFDVELQLSVEESQ